MRLTKISGKVFKLRLPFFTLKSNESFIVKAILDLEAEGRTVITVSKIMSLVSTKYLIFTQ